MLSTQGAIYSFGDLYTNFSQVFQAFDFSHLHGKEVLLLGLGLGSIPEMLEQRFKQSFRYTAVEIDETVSWLAHHYVLQHLNSPIQIISADAIGFLEQTSRQFDLICMDVFQDDRIPEAFEEEPFLQRLKHCLVPDGLLIYNRLAMTPIDKVKSKQFYQTVFLSVFPEGGYYDSRTNWMLINQPDWLKGSRRELK